MWRQPVRGTKVYRADVEKKLEDPRRLSGMNYPFKKGTLTVCLPEV